MATNTVRRGTKRKDAPSGKSRCDAPLKKTRVALRPKNLQKEPISSETRDGDDGNNNDGPGLAPLSDSEDGKDADAEMDSKSAKPKAQGQGYKPGQGESSKEAHAKQKQIAKERKAAKPLANELQRTKKLWERLRRKSHVPKEERRKLIEELYSIINGRVKDFVLKHDAVRAVQTAIKYSTAAQRREIAKELQGAYVVLAESRYAKFLIGKVMAQGDEAIRDMIIPEFYGHVRKLINHPEASWILDDIYRTVATKKQKAMLLREWYGPEFALFKLVGGDDAEDSADLPRILELEPSKTSTVKKYLFDMINALVQKKLTGFTMLHDAMLQYYSTLKPDSQESREFLEVIKEDEGGDLLKNMAFTKSGAWLVCLLLAHGTPKDRKALLKTYKDTFHLLCGDDHGYMIILTAYDVIDDTKATAKTIFPELLGKDADKYVESALFMANNLNARNTVLYLFQGASRLLFPAGRSHHLALLQEVHRIRQSTSKKDAEVRRSELIAAVSPNLIAAVARAADNLVRSGLGCLFVADVLLFAVGDKSSALDAVAATAAGDPNEVDEDVTHAAPPLHPALDPLAGRMLRSLVAGGRFDKETGTIKPVEPPLQFADILYPVIRDHVVTWATGPNSFVVLSLLEAADFSRTSELKSILMKNKQALTKAATESTPDQRAKREEAEARPKSKSKKQAPGSAGNVGAKLIIQTIA